MNQPAIGPAARRGKLTTAASPSSTCCRLWEVLSSLVPETAAVALCDRHLALRGGAALAAGVGAAHQRPGSGAPRAGPGESGSAGLVGDHPVALRGAAADSSGRGRAQPSTHAVGPAPHRGRQRRVHRGRRRARHHAPRRFHHHAVLDVARPRQRGERPGGVARRPGHSPGALPRLRVRRELPAGRAAASPAPRATRSRATATICCRSTTSQRRWPLRCSPIPTRARASRSALLQRDGAPHPAHGYKMQFINPATGGYAMPTMAAFVQLLPAGFSGHGLRSTDATVFHVIEGGGEAGGRRPTPELPRAGHLRGAGVEPVPPAGRQRIGAVQLLGSPGAARARALARRAAGGVMPILPGQADAAFDARGGRRGDDVAARRCARPPRGGGARTPVHAKIRPVRIWSQCAWPKRTS